MYSIKSSGILPQELSRFFIYTEVSKEHRNKQITTTCMLFLLAHKVIAVFSVMLA